MSGELTIGRMLAAPGMRDCEDGATIRWTDGTIAAVTACGRREAAGAAAGLLAMPALVNAHDHGRGLRQLAFGARDQQLELWRAALYAHPAVDPYLNAAVAFARLALSGVGTVVHVHSSIVVDRLADDAEAVARAARDVGIRLAFVLPLRDCRTLGYGDDESMVARHPPADRDVIRERWLYPYPSPADYMALVRDVAGRIEGPTVTVQLGPNSPIACSDALLEATARESADSGRRVHTHLLETAAQRKWSDARYPHGLVRHLDDLGLLSPRFTGAHGVWLSPEDCRLMAERGSTVAVNTSSNLRLRSGIAPVSDYIDAGMGFALGVDSSSFDDDDDAFKEMRVTHWLHSLHGSAAPLTPARLLEAALRRGFEVATGRRDYGEIAPGMPADMVVLDYEAMACDVIDGMVDETDVLLTRSTRRHVRDLIVDGRRIVEDGRAVGVDLDHLERELLAQVRAAAPAMRALRPVIERSQATLRDFYGSGGHLKGE
jgi:cytosine/adenosine deaminase-related metal-dependent hydrolase